MVMVLRSKVGRSRSDRPHWGYDGLGTGPIIQQTQQPSVPLGPSSGPAVTTVGGSTVGIVPGTVWTPVTPQVGGPLYGSPKGPAPQVPIGPGSAGMGPSYSTYATPLQAGVRAYVPSFAFQYNSEGATDDCQTLQTIQGFMQANFNWDPNQPTTDPKFSSDNVFFNDSGYQEFTATQIDLIQRIQSALGYLVPLPLLQLSPDYYGNSGQLDTQTLLSWNQFAHLHYNHVQCPAEWCGGVAQTLYPEYNLITCEGLKALAKVLLVTALANGDLMSPAIDSSPPQTVTDATSGADVTFQPYGGIWYASKSGHSDLLLQQILSTLSVTKLSGTQDPNIQAIRALPTTAPPAAGKDAWSYVASMLTQGYVAMINTDLATNAQGIALAFTKDPATILARTTNLTASQRAAVVQNYTAGAPFKLKSTAGFGFAAPKMGLKPPDPASYLQGITGKGGGAPTVAPSSAPVTSKMGIITSAGLSTAPKVPNYGLQGRPPFAVITDGTGDGLMILGDLKLAIYQTLTGSSLTAGGDGSITAPGPSTSQDAPLAASSSNTWLIVGAVALGIGALVFFS